MPFSEHYSWLADIHSLEGDPTNLFLVSIFWIVNWTGSKDE